MERKLNFYLLIALAAASVICITGSRAGAIYAAESNDNGQDTLAEKVCAKADWIFEHAQQVRYLHNHHRADLQVRPVAGQLVCRNDCSGFVSYLIHAVSPERYEVIRSRQLTHPYPQAKTYARFFGALSSSFVADGWVRVANYKHLRPGDFIAWEKGRISLDHGGHGNSGHVMLVYGQPGRIWSEIIQGRTYRMVEIPVLDSSSVYHFPPEVLPPNAGQTNRSGLAKGTVRLVLDAADRAIGYWEGTYWTEGQREITCPTLSNTIFFGRMLANL